MVDAQEQTESFEQRMAKATHVYIGKRDCGCMVAVVVDVPGEQKHTGKDVAEFIRSGLHIERVTFEAYHALPRIGCYCPKTAR